jgi:hypothetical protein
MSRRCMGCLSWIKHDEECPVCAKRARTANAGAAPEFSSKRTTREARAASVFRHPSGRPRISDATTYPCFLHNQPDRFECEGCLRNGEMDDEYRWVDGADL